eukprot:36147-Chlamydomonas_euryale.AAC.1
MAPMGFWGQRWGGIGGMTRPVHAKTGSIKVEAGRLRSLPINKYHEGLGALHAPWYGARPSWHTNLASSTARPYAAKGTGINDSCDTQVGNPRGLDAQHALAWQRNEREARNS